MLSPAYTRSPDGAWGEWPVLSPRAHEYLNQALESQQWAISGVLREDRELFERRFARLFADYVGAPIAVPTDHGSSALVIALEALNLPAASEVIVPALTWVATASAVFRAGHVPVVCDVDPATGNMDPWSLEEAISERTGAIIVVHWGMTMADVAAICEVGAKRGISIIEDASQSHGAEWQGRCAGTFGTFGCFSLQQAKVLAGGEGGVVVANSSQWRVTLEELRADSRSWRPEGAERGPVLGLQESVGIMGSNYCMSEFSAALLCAQIETLDVQHQVRNKNFYLLQHLLSGIDGISLPSVSPKQNKLSIYELPVNFSGSCLTENNRRAANIQASLGVKVYQPRHPLIGSSLLKPWTKTGLAPLTALFNERHEDAKHPHAERIANESVVFHHSALLASEEEINRLATTLIENR
jgi:dTDP-4-amino-4,6-dideoxygalactose transaminase